MTPEYEIFKEHGITADLNCLMMRTQELAMAVNLQGSHDAHAHYGASVSAHGGHSLTVMTKPRRSAWNDRSGIRREIELPNIASTAEQRFESFQNLSEAIRALTTLLKEDQPS